ncbi:MAG: xanthine permease [Deltaproteobacteria bacterium]|nr:xanthine permease [Deltaproteobacteria bacterium]
MEFKYGLEDRPPLWEAVMVGLQWCALAVPFMIILGKVASAVHTADPEYQTVYLQKTAFVMAAFLILEIFLGHGFPLVMGPSAIILIGIISSQGFDIHTIYTAVASGGLILALSGITGLFGYLQPLFTRRVVGVVLLLITFTLMPTILKLISGPKDASSQTHVIYALILISATLICHRFFKGIWKSQLILLSMAAGSIVYFILVPENLSSGPIFALKPLSSFFRDTIIDLSFDTGLFISFLVSFVALSINDIGSIQSINAFTKSENIVYRLNRGIFFTGLANVASGLFGVIGQVNYSISVGVVTATGSLSRFTLIPAALFLLLISFSPMMIGFLGAVPPVVIGSVMLYVLCTQVYASLIVAFDTLGKITFREGMIVGIPLIVATIIAFMPFSFFHNVPHTLQPVVSNGFVMGFITLLVLEHGIFRKRD